MRIFQTAHCHSFSQSRDSRYPKTNTEGKENSVQTAKDRQVHQYMHDYHVSEALAVAMAHRPVTATSLMADCSASTTEYIERWTRDFQALGTGESIKK